MFTQKNLITTEDCSIKELEKVIYLAGEMKKYPKEKKWSNLLNGKTFLLLFHNPSLRTHLSFETAITQLGGHPSFRTPQMGWIKTSNKITSGESLKDAAKVMSRYVDGIGIRIIMDAVSYYGMGSQVLREYAKWATVPIINMADDTYHPCQGLADLQGWAEWYGQGNPELSQLRGKKILITWAKSGLARPWSSVQSHILLASRFGMHVTLAYPKGYELDNKIINKAKQYSEAQRTEFRIVNDPEIGYEDAHVVYVRNWVTKDAYQNGCFNYQEEVKKSLLQEDWITTTERMSKTNNAIFANPMPVDRDVEAVNQVIDSPNSVIYEVAENRLHIQKALLTLMLGDSK